MIIINQNIILYSTGCPQCKVLKQKLDAKGIHYIENNSVDEMLALGIRQAPTLSVDGVVMNFKSAIAWVNQQ